MNLGIPAERTERIIPVTRCPTRVFETENEDAFISIPALFRQNAIPVPHGLVLKPGPATCKWQGKTTLLTPKVDIDLEIPEEKIHPLPESFSGLYSFFRGACFSGSGDDLILIVDPEKLIIQQSK